MHFIFSLNLAPLNWFIFRNKIWSVDHKQRIAGHAYPISLSLCFYITGRSSSTYLSLQSIISDHGILNAFFTFVLKIILTKYVIWMNSKYKIYLILYFSFILETKIQFNHINFVSIAHLMNLIYCELRTSL